MELLNKYLLIFLLFSLYCNFLFSQIDNSTDIIFEVTENFSGFDVNDKTITWGTLNVPENWGNENENRVKLGVTILNSFYPSKEALVFIQGGPGGSAIKTLPFWISNNIRDSKNIVLLDLRGTGFSEPKLCPGLGKSFLNILAEDHDSNSEITAKIDSALKCKDHLLDRSIDIYSYNSVNMAFDLHALKEKLGYNKWSVYSASYGTRVSYDYVSRFPEDIEKLILDSPILVEGFHNNIASNSFNSLNILFDRCSKSDNCKSKYGDIRDLFFKTLKDLKENPITVKVSKTVHPSGRFVFNAQDFMITVQEALGNRKLFDVLPLMINEIYNRNTRAISLLVSVFEDSFSNIDYGTYYCVLCNETLDYDSLNSFEVDGSQFDEYLSESLSYFKADYFICNKWRSKSHKFLKKTDSLYLIDNIPTLILSGLYDPTVPVENGKLLDNIIKISEHVILNDGHLPGFTNDGKEIMNSFLNSKIDSEIVNKIKNSRKQNFVTKVVVNSGVSGFVLPIMKSNGYIIIPLVIMILIFLISAFYMITFLIKKNDLFLSTKVICYSSFLISLISMFFIVGTIYSIIKTAEINFSILIFGLLDKYSFILKMPYVILTLVLFTLIYYLKKSLSCRRLIMAELVLFSSISLIAYYFYYFIF